KGWRLAANGSIVDKVRCRGKQWHTANGELAPSIVCVREPTSPGIPATPKPLVCPALTPASLTMCQTDNPAPKKCTNPTLAEPTITCPAMMYVIAGGVRWILLFYFEGEGCYFC
ncbi:hypothetical protein PENTCL1PPCAC_14339, partial [Pristionchus entomophagus]